MRKIALILIIAILLTGCSHGTEIKQRGIVEGVYIERDADGGFTVVCEVLNSSVDASKKRSFESESGDNLDEIFLSLENNTATEQFYKNVSVVVVDKNFTINEMQNIIRDILSNPDFESSTKIVFCDFNDEYLDKQIENQIMISSEINTLIENIKKEGMAVSGSLMEISIMQENNGFITVSEVALDQSADFLGICYLTDTDIITLDKDETLYHSLIINNLEECRIVYDNEQYEIFNIQIEREALKKSDKLYLSYEIKAFARSQSNNSDLNSFIVMQIENVYNKLYENEIDFLDIRSSCNFYDLDYQDAEIEIRSDIEVNEIKK